MLTNFAGFGVFDEVTDEDLVFEGVRRMGWWELDFFHDGGEEKEVVEGG